MEKKENNNLKVVFLIPSLNPDEKLVNYINDLSSNGVEDIIVVNDGSSKEYDKYFDEIKDKCVILRHMVNQGKGRAMKTGFNYYLEHYKNYFGVVTADSDGQHSVEDTIKVAEALQNNHQSLVLGCRNFNQDDVPFKSRYGNKITSFVFKMLYGKKISDTQTGLRGFSNEFIKKCLKLTGEKYDLEINMLIEAVNLKIDIKEVIIKTIYLEDNKSSHFNPIKDSLKIYKILFGNFLKFTFSGLFSSLVDLLLFTLFVGVIHNFINNEYFYILISTILARIISSFVNYSLNKNVVFNSDKKLTLIKYYVLVVIQMILSASFVSLLFKLTNLNETICKIIIDLILFFVSYQVQRKIIFRKGDYK